MSVPFINRPKLTLWQKIAASKVLFISIIIHLLVGVGATVYVVEQYFTERPMVFTGGPPTTNPSKRALEHKVSMGKKKNMMSAPAQAKRITTTNSLAKIALPDMPTVAGATEVMPSRMAGLGGTGFGIGAAGAGGGMGGGGGGSGINFFGLRTQTRDVVFIVDVSSSMVDPPKNARTYEALEAEVTKVIQGLNPVTRFGLVAFSRDADVYRESLSNARTDEKNRALAWLKKQSPLEVLAAGVSKETRERHIGTRADKGFDRAFRMRPDTIFFVSDGAPTGTRGDELLALLQTYQTKLPRPAVINTIAYLADSGQGLMRTIAEQNRGVFREINP